MLVTELAAAEARLSDTSRSLTAEAGPLVPGSERADQPTVVLAVLCAAGFVSGFSRAGRTRSSTLIDRASSGWGATAAAGFAPYASFTT
jgi:hypothetical protein